MMITPYKSVFGCMLSGMDVEGYKTAKSNRPTWANLLIAALVVFIAGIAWLVLSGSGIAYVAFGAAVVLAAIAGVSALMSARN